MTVYFLFANVNENELTHFYIPNEVLTEEDHKYLNLASQVDENKNPTYTKDVYIYILNKINDWWVYCKNGSQVGNFTHIYSFAIMNMD